MNNVDEIKEVWFSCKRYNARLTPAACALRWSYAQKKEAFSGRMNAAQLYRLRRSDCAACKIGKKNASKNAGKTKHNEKVVINN